MSPLLHSAHTAFAGPVGTGLGEGQAEEEQRGRGESHASCSGFRASLALIISVCPKGSVSAVKNCRPRKVSAHDLSAQGAGITETVRAGQTQASRNGCQLPAIGFPPGRAPGQGFQVCVGHSGVRRGRTRGERTHGYPAWVAPAAGLRQEFGR